MWPDAYAQHFLLLSALGAVILGLPNHDISAPDFMHFAGDDVVPTPNGVRCRTLRATSVPNARNVFAALVTLGGAAMVCLAMGQVLFSLALLCWAAMTVLFQSRPCAERLYEARFASIAAWGITTTTSATGFVLVAAVFILALSSSIVREENGFRRSVYRPGNPSAWVMLQLIACLVWCIADARNILPFLLILVAFVLEMLDEWCLETTCVSGHALSLLFRAAAFVLKGPMQ